MRKTSLIEKSYQHCLLYVIKRLNNFFETWYTPKNLAIFISGDIDVGGTMETIVKYFGDW